METDLIQDGGQVKRQTDIDHHGPKYILIICHLPDPPIFSLPTTFKELSWPKKFLSPIFSYLVHPVLCKLCILCTSEVFTKMITLKTKTEKQKK
jgi:hypothetical protein